MPEGQTLLLGSLGRSLLSALALLAPPCLSAPAPLYNDPDRGNVTGGKLAMCIIDTVQATNALGRAGTNLAYASRICNKTGNPADTRAECSAGVNEILASLGQAASFLSTASSNCANGISLKALCSGDVTGFIAALNLIGVSGSVMADACQEAAKSAEDAILRRMGVAKTLSQGNATAKTAEGSNFGPSALDGRRLSAELFQPSNVSDSENGTGISMDRQIAIADCFFDVNQAAWYLARAGVALSESIEQCNPEWIANQTGETGKQMCSIDINGIVGSFAYTANFISIAVSQCPVGENPAADCASSVAGLVAALSSLAAAGSSFTLTCGREDLDREDPGIGPGRRLEEVAEDPFVI